MKQLNFLGTVYTSQPVQYQARTDKHRSAVKELSKSETNTSATTNTVNVKAAEVHDQRKDAIICVILSGCLS